VQTLLGRGADINSTGNISNALYTALSRGFEKVARVLLDRGAEVNYSGEYSDVLYAISSRGYINVV
jgi:ankyrin repeat protein